MTTNISNRTVVGFDLRTSSSLDNLFMTSYDEAIRYEEINDKYQSYQSGINLFYMDPSKISSLKIPSDAEIIAFDLPTKLVNHLASRNVSNPAPFPEIDITRGWKFMGFDIVDPFTQTSAFHGFDFAESYLNDVLLRNSTSLNNRGLIDDEQTAQKLALFFDGAIPEHAPFTPCGIWLKKSSSNNS